MQFDRIQALIEEGRTIERQTGMLRRAVVNLARVNGRNVSEPEVQKIVNFVAEYIAHAPAIMKLIEDAAADSDAHRYVQLLLDTIESYFLTPDDTIPDRLGLVGLLDDAYVAHSLMQAISDKYKSKTGKSLLPMEPHEDNAFVRRLIGEPFVSILDDHVTAMLGSPSMRDNIRQILNALGQLDLPSGPDPIWGNAHASEVTDARLWTIGV